LQIFDFSQLVLTFVTDFDALTVELILCHLSCHQSLFIILFWQFTENCSRTVCASFGENVFNESCQIFWPQMPEAPRQGTRWANRSLFNNMLTRAQRRKIRYVEEWKKCELKSNIKAKMTAS